MDPETYRTMVVGSVQDFERIIQENEVPVLDQVTIQGNTILHLASMYGHVQLVSRILEHELGVGTLI